MSQAAQSEAIQKWLVAKKRVILLYEDYIHLLPLQQVIPSSSCMIRCLQVYQPSQGCLLLADLGQPSHRKASPRALFCSCFPWD